MLLITWTCLVYFYFIVSFVNSWTLLASDCKLVRNWRTDLISNFGWLFNNPKYLECLVSESVRGWFGDLIVLDFPYLTRTFKQVLSATISASIWTLNANAVKLSLWLNFDASIWEFCKTTGDASQHMIHAFILSFTCIRTSNHKLHTSGPGCPNNKCIDLSAIHWSQQLTTALSRKAAKYQPTKRSPEHAPKDTSREVHLLHAY